MHLSLMYCFKKDESVLFPYSLSPDTTWYCFLYSCMQLLCVLLFMWLYVNIHRIFSKRLLAIIERKKLINLGCVVKGDFWLSLDSIIGEMTTLKGIGKKEEIPPYVCFIFCQHLLDLIPRHLCSVWVSFQGDLLVLVGIAEATEC